MQTLPESLVALSAKRTAEDAAGTVRWLCPEFHTRACPGEHAAIEMESEAEESGAETTLAATTPAAVQPAPRARGPPGLPSRSRPRP